MKLIALPFAGGMGNEFKSWKALFSKQIELITVQYPGRGQRSKEPCTKSFNELLEDIYKQVLNYIVKGENYMLLGHSMGAIFTYELYFKLKENHKQLPCYIFFSGNRTPKECLQEDKTSDLTEDKFREYFIQLGGISNNILDDEKLSYGLFKRLRYDVCTLESYIYKPKTSEVICDISVFNGTQDTFVSSKEKWEALLGKNCDYQSYEGGHFFIFNQKKSITHYIEQIARRFEVSSVV